MMNFSDSLGVAYKGFILPEQCAEGINLARENARRLIDDARLLFAAKRYPSAAQLAILAIEESGKEAILRSLAAAEADDEAKARWEEYRQHSKKNIRWVAPGLADRGHSFREMLAATTDPQLARVIERFKQLATYTDCVNQGVWRSPANFVNRAAAADLIDRAERLSAKLPPVTGKEIEISARHERLLNRAVAEGAPPQERQRIYLKGQAELRENGFHGLTEEDVKVLLSDSLDLRGIGRTK
jgi:AbiV family abortive infection protein